MSANTPISPFTMNFLRIIALVTALLQAAFCETYVTVYEHSNYRGGAVVLADLEEYSYIYFTAFDDVTTSFKITTGSCVEMHMNTPPGYGSENDWFWSMEDIANVGDRYNDRISSVKSCGRRSSNIICPVGTFVKKVLWDNSNVLRDGIEIHCFYPTSKTANVTKRTHGGPTLNGKTECTGIRGMRYSWNSGRQIHESVEPLCRQENSDDNTFACEPKQAVVGLNVELENRSDFIKSSSVVCQDVGNIEAICAAHDRTNVLFTCDASTALFPLKCTHAKTMGYGYSKSMSEEQRNEQIFYREFGFEIGAAGYGLSANFRSTMGFSNTTGYNWTTTEENTFQQEVTMAVEAETPAGCKTEVVEVVGECSFMEARPFYFIRRDVCNDVVFETEVKILKTVSKENVFVIKVPENVQKYLDKKGLM